MRRGKPREQARHIVKITLYMYNTPTRIFYIAGDETMDITILLGLQDFRNGIGSCLADFMAKMTYLGELNTVLAIMAIIYWCFSKEYGTYMMMGWSGNRLMNGALKVTACAYRPWIRDSRIIPYGNSMTTATGYSFPSGHTMNGTTVFGSAVVRKDLPRVLRILAAVLMVLIAFSRIYLGVHTPQDILVGMAAGLLVMGLTVLLMRWIAEHPGKDWIVACAGIFLAAAVAVYAMVKSYPEDLDANGKLLVDGAKMANDTLKGASWCAAFLTGWILERRFVGFTTEVTMIRRLTRLITGLLCFYAVTLVLVPLIKDGIGGPAGVMISCFFQMIFISFIFPLCIKRFEKAQ